MERSQEQPQTLTETPSERAHAAAPERPAERAPKAPSERPDRPQSERGRKPASERPGGAQKKAKKSGGASAKK
ncbi:hypothetical protein KBZ21_42295, partial [Streptomyces sp. A73]|nr:hypothetical protein [Streptomyces sp. A73]